MFYLENKHLDYKNINLIESQNRFCLKGLTIVSAKRCDFFPFVVLVKIFYKIGLKYVLQEEKVFQDYKNIDIL